MLISRSPGVVIEYRLKLLAPALPHLLGIRTGWPSRVIVGDGIVPDHTVWGIQRHSWPDALVSFR